MNKQRRKALAEIVSQLEEAKRIITSSRCELEDLQDEEYEAYENLPNSLHDSERGEIMSNNADILEEAASDLDGLDDQIEDILTNLENIE